MEGPPTAPNPGDAAPGCSTAEVVLEKFQSFLSSSARVVQERMPHTGEWHRLSVDLPQVTLGNANGEGEPGRLVLGDSPVARAVSELSAALKEARSCVASSPALCQPMAVFGTDKTGDDAELDNRELVVEFAELLPAFSCLRQHIERVAEVAAHLVRQMVGLQAAAATVGLDRLPLRPILDALGELLVVPVTVDGMSQDGVLEQNYDRYKIIVGREMDAGPGSGELSLEAAIALNRQLADAEPLVKGDAFRVCLEQVLGALQSVGPESSVAVIRDQLNNYFRTRLEESGPDSRTASAHLWLPGESLAPWLCTLVLFVKLWSPSWCSKRPSLVGEVLKLVRRSPVVVLSGNVAFSAVDFLCVYLKKLVDDSLSPGEKAEMQALDKRQVARLDGDGGSFAQEMERCRAGIQAWLAGLGNTGRAIRTGKTAKALTDAQVMLIKGLVLALRVRSKLQEFLILHDRLRVPLPKSALPALSLGFQMLKALESGASTPWWSEVSVLLQRYFALNLQSEIEDIRKQLGRRHAARLCGAALKVALAALDGVTNATVPSQQLDSYLDAGSLALSCAGHADQSGAWRDFSILVRWRQQMTRLCDTSWCYWIPGLFRTLLESLKEVHRGIAGLPQLCRAFADPLERGLVLADSRLGCAYLREVSDTIDQIIVEPLCKEIEEDLRLHTHAVMEGKVELLPKVASPDALTLLGLRPLRLMSHKLVDVRDQVEVRLAKTFYDLTVVAPQDAETYERMRLLVRERYGLDVPNSHLPRSSLDHGLDVVDVMRNVHHLAGKFSYNLHQQFFTQSDNQTETKIRTITMEHVANSFQVHGVGVINTIVNYTYGFLGRKLEQVVKFLSDESVKSRMMADRQWLEGSRTSPGEQCYSWARAHETVSFMRRHLLDSDRLPLLDKLRQAVAQIGNSLGYVRMVRNAGMQYSAKGLTYAEATAARGLDADVGDAGESKARIPLRQAAEAADCQREVVEAARIADEAAHSVRGCFEASTDYLNLLTQVFAAAIEKKREIVAAALPSGSTAPPMLFYLLVPSLSISFIDAFLGGREALEKRATLVNATGRSMGNAICFDDGFAVGVAFLLRVFGEDKDFQALHWLNSAITDNDVAEGLAAKAAGGVGLPFAEGHSNDTRRGLLEKERRRLASSLETAASLFGSADRPSRSAEPAEAELAADQ